MHMGRDRAGAMQVERQAVRRLNRERVKRERQQERRSFDMWSRISDVGPFPSRTTPAAAAPHLAPCLGSAGMRSLAALAINMAQFDAGLTAGESGSSDTLEHKSSHLPRLAFLLGKKEIEENDRLSIITFLILAHAHRNRRVAVGTLAKQGIKAVSQSLHVVQPASQTRSVKRPGAPRILTNFIRQLFAQLEDKADAALQISILGL